MVFATTSTTSLPQGRRAYHLDTQVGETRESKSGLFLQLSLQLANYTHLACLGESSFFSRD